MAFKTRERKSRAIQHNFLPVVSLYLLNVTPKHAHQIPKWCLPCCLSLGRRLRRTLAGKHLLSGMDCLTCASTGDAKQKIWRKAKMRQEPRLRYAKLELYASQSSATVFLLAY